MNVSTRGLALISQEEQTRLQPYKDATGNLTIGTGHLLTAQELDTRLMCVDWTCGITQDQAHSLLAKDAGYAAQAVALYVKVPLNQNQFDALVDFTYNVGVPHFQGSILLRRLNAGDYAGVPVELARWTHSGGVLLADLVTRRARDTQLWNTPP